MITHYTTQLGYGVTETQQGLEVTEDDKYLCTLTGKTFSDYTYNDEVNDDKLETDIKEEVSIEEFLENQQGNWLTNVKN